MFRFSDPPPFVTPQVGWPLVLVLIIILLIVIAVSLRRQKVERDRKWMAMQHPEKARATYVAAQNLKVAETNNQEYTNAFTDQTRTNHR